MKIATLVLLALIAPCTWAKCDDTPLQLTRDYLDQWEIIAYGTVVEVQVDRSAPHNGFAVLKLERIWKGAPINPLRVYNSDSVHGYPFEKGKAYLLFAYEEENRVKTSMCSPTCTGMECKEALGVLGNPSQTLK